MKADSSSKLVSDRGEIASSLIIFLVAISAFMITVHAMFVYHGNNVVKAAAQDTLAAGQIAFADRSPGTADYEAVRQVGRDRLGLFPGLTTSADSVVVTVDFEQGTVSVTVKAKVETPFFVDANTDLETTIVGPIEQFYEQFEREAS